jgi:hypothetical protein
MSTIERITALPRTTIEFTNVILTTPDAEIGPTPRDAV